MAPGDDVGPMKQRELHGWKEIGDYLGRSVRTAQRWEREFGLPVRRLRTAAGETVYALTTALDDWKKTVTRKDVDAGLDDAEPGDAADRRDDWSAGADAPRGDASAGDRLDGPAAATPPPPLAPRRSSALVRRFALLMLLLAGTTWGVMKFLAPSGRVDATPEPSSATVLDPGPWPTNGHDMQRTNRADLPGPRNPATPHLLYELREPDGQLFDLVSTMDGRILLGSCGRVIGLDREGREVWSREVRSVSGLPEQPAGFTAGSTGTIYFTAFDCPDHADLVQTHLYQVSSAGILGRSVDIGSSYNAPAIGPSRTVYTIDEVNFLRQFDPSMTGAGGTTLAGFSSGGIAIDPRGNLYVGTNGGETHQPSFWSLSPEGEVRWNALREALGQAAVGTDRVYVASLNGNVYAFSFDGRTAWSKNVGPIGSLQPLALGQSGSLYVQTAKDIVCLRPDGEIAWRRGDGASATRSHPILDRHEDVYATLGDAVVSFTRDGRERWRVPVPHPMNLFLGSAGVLYVTTPERRLYAIAEK